MRLTALLASVLLLAGCHSPSSPSLPPATTPDPTRSTIPTHIQILAASRQDQRLDVTAQVLSADGHGVPSIPVSFTVGDGTVTPSLVTSDGNGNAKTVAVTTAPTTITADIGGGITASFTSTIPSASSLSVSLSVPSVVVNTTSTLTASANSQPIGGPFTYTWTFGDGKTESGSASAIGHAYPGIGSYAASVTVRDGGGRTATSTATASVTDVPVVPPVVTPPAPVKALAATVSCTAQAHGTPTPCNVSVTYGADIVASNAVTSIVWDFGDGFTETVLNSPIRSRNYAQAGTYTVAATVTATTSDGAARPPADRVYRRSITVN
jgi:hypothetical protein